MASDVTNRDLLAGAAYGDDRHLAARQAIYHWQIPRYDLPGIVVAELAGTAGLVVDVGCGNGTFLRRLHTERPDLRTVGLDVPAGILQFPPPGPADTRRDGSAATRTHGHVPGRRLHKVAILHRAYGSEG